MTRATPAEIQHRIDALLAARRQFFLAEPAAPTPLSVKHALRGYDAALAEFKRREQGRAAPGGTVETPICGTGGMGVAR